MVLQWQIQVPQVKDMLYLLLSEFNKNNSIRSLHGTPQEITIFLCQTVLRGKKKEFSLFSSFIVGYCP